MLKSPDPVTQLDILTLQQMEDCEKNHEPSPPAFVDTLVRLSRLGYIQGDGAGDVQLTSRGRKFLEQAPGRPH